MDMTDRPLQRGDFVTLAIDTWTRPAMVGLASPNGVSLIVLFDGAAPIAGGFAVGMLALLQEDGVYRDLMSRTPVHVTRAPKS